MIKNNTNTIAGDDQTGSRFIRPDGYARRLGCSRRHVEHLMKRGIIPFLKTGHRSIFIPIDEADAALLKLAANGKVGS